MEITQDCERALDLYEGYPRLYIKEEVKIKVKGKAKIAMVYVMTSEYTNMAATPTEYYFNVIARGYCDNRIDLKSLQLAY